MIYRFDLHEDGGLSGKKILIEFEPDWGYPDGMTVDCEGALWVAHWDGARISRFDPDGQAHALHFPARLAADQLRLRRARSGPDVRHLGANRPEDEELAGGLFEVEPGTSGLPAHRFAG